MNTFFSKIFLVARGMSDHGPRMMPLVPSRFQWHKFKDLFHFYVMVGVIPVAAIVFCANVFVGPATLTEIPSGYVPNHWEYHRVSWLQAILLHGNNCIERVPQWSSQNRRIRTTSDVRTDPLLRVHNFSNKIIRPQLCISAFRANFSGFWQNRKIKSGSNWLHRLATRCNQISFYNKLLNLVRKFMG